MIDHVTGEIEEETIVDQVDMIGITAAMIGMIVDQEEMRADQVDMIGITAAMIGMIVDQEEMIVDQWEIDIVPVLTRIIKATGIVSRMVQIIETQTGMRVDQERLTQTGMRVDQERLTQTGMIVDQAHLIITVEAAATVIEEKADMKTEGEVTVTVTPWI